METHKADGIYDMSAQDALRHNACLGGIRDWYDSIRSRSRKKRVPITLQLAKRLHERGRLYWLVAQMRGMGHISTKAYCGFIDRDGDDLPKVFMDILAKRAEHEGRL